MEIILKKWFNKHFLFLILLLNTHFLSSQELADKRELDLYMELLQTSGEIINIPSYSDLQIILQNYIVEVKEHKANIKDFYNILNKLGYIQNNITEMEFRNYKEHFFERKQMEIFTEYVRIEWEDKSPKLIIFRSKSSLMPNLNTRNTVFVLPFYQFDDVHSNEKQEPILEVLARLYYQTGLGEEFYFVFTADLDNTKLYSNYKNKIYNIFDFRIGGIEPKIINDPRFKLLTYQYIIYRLRYLDIKFRAIIRNQLRKNQSEFYRSIPDSRY